ncbi:MAG: hypothetical protein WBE80_04915 [Methylocella sp.]
MSDRPAYRDEVATKEIDISPEMIEAGVKMLFNYDPDFSNEKDIVAEIFMAMLSVSASHSRERL